MQLHEYSSALVDLNARFVAETAAFNETGTLDGARAMNATAIEMADLLADYAVALRSLATALGEQLAIVATGKVH